MGQVPANIPEDVLRRLYSQTILKHAKRIRDMEAALKNIEERNAKKRPTYS